MKFRSCVSDTGIMGLLETSGETSDGACTAIQHQTESIAVMDISNSPPPPNCQAWPGCSEMNAGCWPCPRQSTPRTPQGAALVALEPVICTTYLLLTLQDLPLLLLETSKQKRCERSNTPSRKSESRPVVPIWSTVEWRPGHLRLARTSPSTARPFKLP